jgi:Na+/melibiose symporter-like transporter
VHAPLAALAWAMVMAGAQESREALSDPLDVGGLVTLSLAVLGLTFYITQAPETGYGDGMLLGVLLVAVMSLVAFVRVERRHAHPMFDFGVFRIRAFSGAIMGSIGMNFSFWPLMIYLPIYFHGVLGYDTVTAGTALLAYTAPTLAMPPLAERWAQRYGAGRVIPAGLALIGLGFLAMYAGSLPTAADWQTILPGAVLSGVGLGLTNTLVSNTTTGSVPASRTGMASGIDMSSRLITLAINIALMGSILVAGIAWHLRGVTGPALDGDTLRALAARIAVGDLAAAQRSIAGLDASALAREALAHGFAWLWWYGGLGVLLLAIFSWTLFAEQRRAHRNGVMQQAPAK